MKSAEIEARVTAAIKGLLLDAAVIEEAVREFQASSAQRHSTARVARSKQETELAEVKRRAARLVDQVPDGLLTGAAVQEKLTALESTRELLEAELAAVTPDDQIVFHPSLAGRFRDLVARLNTVLADADTVERTAAREAFRALIRQVVVTPLDAASQPGRQKRKTPRGFRHGGLCFVWVRGQDLNL